jgi:hypothetical protein
LTAVWTNVVNWVDPEFESTRRARSVFLLSPRAQPPLRTGEGTRALVVALHKCATRPATAAIDSVGPVPPTKIAKCIVIARRADSFQCLPAVTRRDRGVGVSGLGWGEMEIEMGSRALAEKSRPPTVGHLFGRSAARHPPDRPVPSAQRRCCRSHRRRSRSRSRAPAAAATADALHPAPTRHRRPPPRPPPPPPRWKWRMRSLALSSTRSACGARARWEKPQDLRGSQST